MFVGIVFIFVVVFRLFFRDGVRMGWWFGGGRVFFLMVVLRLCWMEKGLFLRGKLGCIVRRKEY